MLAADAADFKGAANLVFFSAPRVSGEFEAKRQGAVHLGIGERFFVPLIPSGAEKDTEIGRQLLLHIDAEALLQRALVPVEGDVGSLIDALQISRNRLAVVAHVGVVQISQRTNMSLQALKPVRLPFQFEVIGSGAAQIG